MSAADAGDVRGGESQIRVLIVDDSTFVRRALRRVFREASEIDVVGEARDGEEAVEMARRLRPDVVTLDIQMPGMSGLDVLRMIREDVRGGVIMVSSFTSEGADETLEAMEHGAVDFVDKTSVRNRMDFIGLGQDLVEKIRALSGEDAQAGWPVDQSVPTVVEPDAEPEVPAGRDTEADVAALSRPDSLVVVGASTGGPPAVRRFLSSLSPTIRTTLLVVQHMPPGFTEGFARRLNQSAPLVVSELVSGQRLAAGHAYVIPSGSEIELDLTPDGDITVELLFPDERGPHRPSLDRTLEVAADAFGDRAIAVILTGMGTDGAEGAARLKSHGGRVYAQNEASCVIYGMPKAVRSAVGLDGEGSPEELGAAVLRALRREVDRP